MDQAQTLAANHHPTRTTVARSHPRFFYTTASILLFILMFWGFQRFYLHGKAYPGRELTPAIRPILIAHGICMSIWMVLFIMQPLLIARGNRRLHMKMGILGGVVAAGVVFFGIQVAIGAARVNPPEMQLWGLAPKEFMAVSLSAILFFSLFVVIGILKRRCPEVHRPMMLLATLAAIPAARNRVGPIRNLYSETIWGSLFGPYFSGLLTGLVLLCIHWALTRKLNRSFAIGYAALLISSFAVFHLAPTPAWNAFADLLAQ